MQSTLLATLRSLYLEFEKKIYDRFYASNPQLQHFFYGLNKKFTVTECIQDVYKVPEGSVDEENSACVSRDLTIDASVAKSTCDLSFRSRRG
eukprot:SAG31_NODE_1785_length_7278_cov_4.205321_10_plen_92_part_00